MTSSSPPIRRCRLQRMRRVAFVVLAIAACVPVRLATSATTAPPGFDYGVAAG